MNLKLSQLYGFSYMKWKNNWDKARTNLFGMLGECAFCFDTLDGRPDCDSCKIKSNLSKHHLQC